MSIFSQIPKKLIAGIAVIAAVAGITSAAVAGFGPDRPTKDWTVDQNGFDKVTFNSFVNVPNGIGDERDFLRGGIVGSTTPWIDPVNDTKNDDTVEVKIYIHNNAAKSLNTAAGAPGVAKDVTVKVALPTGIATSQEASATISASNATPVTISDTLGFTGINGSQFSLEYIPGSAKLYAGGSSSAISDNLVTSGVNIGNQNGCFEYVREITFRVKVKKPGYQIQKVARIMGEGNDKWRKEVNAKIGDKIEWEIYFQNIGTTTLTNVTVLDVIPSFNKVVPGSIKLYNSSNPNGYTFPDSAIQSNGKQVNITISDYAPGANAYIYLTTEIQNVKELQCGVQQMANVVYVTPQGLGTLNDNAKVNVINSNPCEEEKFTYECTSVTITKNSNREVTVNVATKATPEDKVRVKNYEYNFGDGTAKFLTDKNVANHTYAKDGTYNINVVVTFSVNGADKTVTCSNIVTFSTPTTPVRPTPTVLPDTGANSFYGLLAGISIVGALLHRLWTLRRN